MPSGECQGCKRVTNSAVSNWWDDFDRAGKPKELGVPTECYAAYVDDAWVKGCAYDRADFLTKMSVNGLLKRPG